MPEIDEKSVLLLVPADTASGGIANYFKVIKDEFKKPVDYFTRGARNWPYRKNAIAEFFRTFSDFINFYRLLNTGNYYLVQTSTSLGIYSLLRDGAFLLIAKSLGMKTIVFFRGWDKRIERLVERHFLSFFKGFYFKCDAVIVLASEFQNKLESWGYAGSIYVETTVVDKSLLNERKATNPTTVGAASSNTINILYLARVEIAKGIYETIDAFSYLQAANQQSELKLLIAGDGRELENAKSYVCDNDIRGIEFVGHVAGTEKANVFQMSDIYIFPSYTEGMPNSVLEAMAFGLPIVASKVGALPELIRDNENGFLTTSKNPKVYAEFIQILLDKPELRKSISENNQKIAHSKFLSDKVVERLELIYSSLH